MQPPFCKAAEVAEGGIPGQRTAESRLGLLTALEFYRHPHQTMNLLGFVGICPVSPRPPRHLRRGTGLRSRIPTGCSEPDRGLMRNWLPRPACPDLIGQPLAGFQAPFCGPSILWIPLLWSKEFVEQGSLHMGVRAYETLPGIME